MSRIAIATVVALVATTVPAFADEPVSATSRKPAAAVPRLVTTAEFDPAGWTRLGAKVVTGKKRSELITLARGTGAPDQLTIVADGDLSLTRITLVTAGGKHVIRGVQHKFYASARSRTINLPRNTRALRSIAVSYRMPKRGRATLTVYGRVTPGAAVAPVVAKPETAPVGEVRLTADTRVAPTISARTGWTLLGAQTVEGSNDRDTVRVPDDAIGMFTQLAIVANGGPLELKDLRVRFAGGATADIDSAYYFRGDDRVRVLALPTAGDGGVVRMIQLRYGGERGGGKTRVEIWAR